MLGSEQRFLNQLDRALAEVDRASTEGWTEVNGESATQSLDRLRQQLISARTAIQRGGPADREPFSGLVRWVTDWIPDVNDPLVAAVAKVERG
jgi:hypothetical protein